MAYEVIILGPLHMPLYFLGTFTEYPYVEKYRPFDKAGAYGVQEWIGYVGVTGMNGSFYNVMGLPVQRLYQELKKL